MTVVDVAVPRKGRPLEAVLDAIASAADATGLADSITSTLRYEKAIAKGRTRPEADAYERLGEYSDLDDPAAPEFTLLRDDRPGKPRRIVFDSVRIPLGDVGLRLIGREEPLRALRKHEVPLGFDSADLVLEEVVSLRPDPLRELADLNDRIDPRDTDVRVVSGLGDTVHHTLLATPERLGSRDLDRGVIEGYEGPLCLSPRYERLVEAVLGTRATEGIEFVHPEEGEEEEAAIARVGLGVYLTVTGSTARDHGLVIGEHLFPSETVLLANAAETGPAADRAVGALAPERRTTEIAI